MKIKTPILVRVGGDYWSKDRKFVLCAEFAQLALNVKETEIFRLIISTKKMKNALKGRLLIEDDEIFFTSKAVTFDEDDNYVDFHTTTELWLLKNFPKLRKENESVKVWVKVKSYGVMA